MEPRKFKLKNGMVIEELQRDDTRTNKHTGYRDDYTIISGGFGGYTDGSWLCLLLTDEGFPVGDAHGPEFNIVEEITS